MNRLWEWLSGWTETLIIRIRKPKLYALLRDDSFEWDDDE